MTTRLRILALVLLGVAGLAAAQEPELVPRRIHVSSNGAQAVDGAPQLTGAADEIYAAVAARTPLVRVGDPSGAQSRLEISIKVEGQAYRLSAALVDGDRPAAVREILLARGASGFAPYAAFVSETADEFAPLLPLVRPQVVMSDVSREERYRSVAQETDFVAQLARRWELTLWASGLSEIYHEPTVEQPEQIDIRTIPLLPLSFDAAWFYGRNGGLIASLYFDYGDFVPLGVIYSLDTRLDKAASTNLFLLPGLGITYRTLARISAQFATVAYFGPVHVAADDAIAGVADAGEDVWTWYFMLSFSSSLSWNITQRLSLKTRVSVSLDMMTTFLDDLSSRDGYAPIHLQFFTVGLAWRP